jgi:hypothetical protein
MPFQDPPDVEDHTTRTGTESSEDAVAAPSQQRATAVTTRNVKPVTVNVNLNAAPNNDEPFYQQVVNWINAGWTTLLSVRHLFKCRRCRKCCQMSRLWKLITSAIATLTVVITLWGMYGGLFTSLTGSDSGSGGSGSSSRGGNTVGSNYRSSASAAATDPPVVLTAPKSAAERQAIVNLINNVTLTGTTLQYSPTGDLDALSSLEELALRWTIELLPYNILTGDESDRYYLVQCYALYTLLARQYTPSNTDIDSPNEPWYDVTNWLDAPDNECAWYGITCTEYNFDGALGQVYAVTSIDLADNNLSGDLSPDVGLLEYVATFDVSGNLLLDGTIPKSVSGWEHVSLFDVTGTSLTGNPPTLV